jgi:hypothetical protein
MRAAKNILTSKALKSAYYSLIHSHLIYGIQIWSTAAKSSLSSLRTKQKNAIRIIFSTAFNAHTESLFKKANILPLDLLIDFFKLQFIHHYVQGYLPVSFNDTWITNEARRQLTDTRFFALRNSDDLYVPPSRISLTQNHPLTAFPRSWTEFNEPTIKILRTKMEFNKALKRHFINSLATTYTCNRLLCPHCHL